MKPCSKSANGVHAARYLRRAETSARSISLNTGAKRSIIDGCIVEGKKVGSLLKANVIEPAGEILGVAANFNPPPDEWYLHRMQVFTCPCGTREPYHPGHPSLPLPDTDPHHHRWPSFDATGRVFGRDMMHTDPEVVLTLSMMSPVYPLATEKHVCFTAYVRDKTDHAQMYLQVIAAKTAAGLNGRFDGDAVFVHNSQIKRFSGEYGIDTLAYYARRSKAIEVSEGVIVVIAVVGKVIEQIPTPSPENPDSVTVIHRESLVRLDIDLRNRNAPKLTGAIFPEHLIPENLRPATVKAQIWDGTQYYTDDIQAKTAMTITDIALDNGNVIAAVKYQVKIQSCDSPESEPEIPYAFNHNVDYGTTVIAYGLASWGGTRSFFDVHSKEVMSGNDHNPLIEAHEVDPNYVLLDNSTNIINGKVVRTAAKVSRTGVLHIGYPDNSRYDFIDPYLVEIVDGVERPRAEGKPVMGLAYGGNGPLYPFGFSVDFERDFYFDSNWVREVNNGNKAYVSETAVAVPASSAITLISNKFMKSADQGVMFVDGGKRRYEQLSLAPSVMEQQHITITCHQKEVRDAKGKLVHPCVLVVGAIINGEHSILVRKGPIWDDDFDGAGYSFERYWKVTKATNNNFNFYFYRGNPLMPAGKYGHFFKLYVEGK